MVSYEFYEETVSRIPAWRRTHHCYPLLPYVKWSEMLNPDTSAAASSTFTASNGFQWMHLEMQIPSDPIRSFQVPGPRSQVPQILGPFSSRNSNPILIFIQFTHIMVLGGTQYLDRSRHRWYSLIIHCSNQHQLPRPPRPSPAPQSAALALQSAPYSWHPAGLSSVGNRSVMSIVLECDGFHLCIVCDPLVEISYVYIYVYTYMYMYMFIYIYIYSAAGCWMFLDILSRLSESTLAHFPSLTLPRVW